MTGAQAWVGIAVAALAAIPYLGGGFVWDDGPLIAERLGQLNGSGILDLWSGPVTVDGPGAAYYRPVSMTALAVLGRMGPWAIHGFAMVLHMACTGLLVLLSRGTRWPLLAGLVFALHPVVSEVLGWCSALPDLLGIALGLAAVWTAHRRPWLTVILLVAAALSKETGLLIPLFFGLGGRGGRRWWISWMSACAVALIARFSMGAGLGVEWVSKLSMSLDALGWSWSFLVWPFPLNAVNSLWDCPAWAVWLGWSLLPLLLVGAIRDRFAAAGLALVVVAPIVALPVMLNGYLVAERYMVPALVGLGMWGAACIPRPVLKSRWLVLCLPVLLATHWTRALDWRSDEALFGAAVDAAPNSSYSWHFLGVVLMKERRFVEASDAFDRSIDAGHSLPVARALKLRALVLAGNSEEGLRWAESGPKEGLSADLIAWWARAAFNVGDMARASSLLEMLKGPQGYEGPPWVDALAKQVLNDHTE